MKRKVYVAGRMRGLPYYNFPAFDEARDRLAGLGLTPLSPADMDRAAGFDPFEMFDEHLVSLAADGGPSCWATVPPSFDLAAAIARDNAAIDDPDTAAVYVIHEGISESAGGMPEIERGMKRGLVILYDTMSDGDILRALGMPVEPQTPPVNPNTTEACRNARAMVMMQEGVKANDPCATVFGKAGAAAMRAHIEKSLVDAVNPPQTFFTDPVTGGRKETKLARHDLLPPDIVHELAEHYGKGARKYGERNMEKGYPWSKTYAACHRHLNSFWQGEDVDAETGSLHLVAAAWHCFTMAWFLRHNAGTDDRPVTGKKGDTHE